MTKKTATTITSTGRKLKNMKRRLIEVRGGDSDESIGNGPEMNTPGSFVVGSKHLVYHRERFPCKSERATAVTLCLTSLGMAEIIETRRDPKDESKTQYYVHYCKCRCKTGTL